MDGSERRREIDFADHLRLAPIFTSRIDDDEVVWRNRSQADSIGGIRFIDPVPVSTALMQKTGFTKLLAKLWEIDITESLIRRNGQFECSAFQMIDENLKIVRLNVGMLGRVSKKVVGMLHDELI